MKFNLISPGEFVIGSPESEAGRGENETQHQVKITKPFFLSECEVTQHEYEQVIGNNPSKSKGDFKPVKQVRWRDAVEFFQELSKQEGVGYRLPTEAEWEYACRAGATTAYSFGDDDSRLSSYAWVTGDETQRVGSLRSNVWGLYDMHGNVSEWCQDWVRPL